MPSEYFTMAQLGTMAGMVVLVALFVQVTKKLVRRTMPDWAVRVYTVIIALLAQAFYVAVKGPYTLEAFGLAFINGVLVAAISMGAYEALADPKAEKRKPDIVMMNDGRPNYYVSGKEPEQKLRI